MSGIDRIPIRIPDVITGEWMRQFIREYLAPLDTRNAVGDGITVSSDGNSVASLDATSTINAAIATHEAAANPHPTYLTQAEADALYRALSGTYASIYVAAGATGQTFDGGTTPVLLTCFNTAEGANGPDNDMTADKAGNRLVATRAGTYRVAYSVSFSCARDAVLWETWIAQEGTALPASGAKAKTGTAGDPVTLSGVALATLAVGDDLDLRAFHDGASTTITVTHASLAASLVGIP